MKKTLVAAAALATLGTAAFAQSSVTLYGRIDASLASQKMSNVGFVNGADFDAGAQIRSGAHTGSRWGLMGSEDLGGGLKANFTLEQGFSVDNGDGSSSFGATAATKGVVTSTRQFHRQAFVGLSGGFGALYIGRQYDIIDQAFGNFDAFGNSGYSAQGYAFNTICSPGSVTNNASAATTGSSVGQVNGSGVANRGLGDCNNRQNNAVQYTTPNMGGLVGKLMWAPGEDKTAVASAGNMYGLMLTYTGGPLGVSGAYQVNKAAGAKAITNWMLGASYDFGVAKLFGQYEGGKNKNAVAAGGFNVGGGQPKDQGWALGVTVPMGAMTFIASYAAEDLKNGGTKVADTQAFSLMGQYALSKRTYVYAAYRDGELDPRAAALATEKQKSYGLGLVHLF